MCSKFGEVSCTNGLQWGQKIPLSINKYIYMSFSHPLWWLLQVLFCYWKTGFMLRCWTGFGKRNKKSQFSCPGRIPHHHPHLEWKTGTENGTKRWKHFWLCLLKFFRLIQCLSNKNHTKHMHKQRLSYCGLLYQQSFFQKLLLYWTALFWGRSTWQKLVDMRWVMLGRKAAERRAGKGFLWIL